MEKPLSVVGIKNLEAEPDVNKEAIPQQPKIEMPEQEKFIADDESVDLSAEFEKEDRLYERMAKDKEPQLV